MYDSLDKIGLKAVLEAVKGKIPTSLPANGGNADTVDGLHANDFTQIIDFGVSETDTKTAIGQSGKTIIYRCSFWTDYPIGSPDGQGVIITVNYSGSGTVGTDLMWLVQLFISARTSNIYKRFINGSTIDNWEEIYTTRNKPYVTGSATVEADSNVCVTNHGFMPSAVIWWESSVFSGVATSFDDTKFIIGTLSNMDRTINYLIFK